MMSVCKKFKRSSRRKSKLSKRIQQKIKNISHDMKTDSIASLNTEPAITGVCQN